MPRWGCDVDAETSVKWLSEQRKSRTQEPREEHMLGDSTERQSPCGQNRGPEAETG